MTTLGTAQIIRADSRNLPLADNSVDLVVTSPPYFALRSYQDGCPACESTGRAKRPDSHGMKVCPDCGNVANRKRCNKCDASMKWPSKAEIFGDDACVTCKGTGTSHYDGQIGSEPTPAEFVDALIEVTRECVRVLKPSGSLWVNLGDKYSQRTQSRRSSHQPGIFPGKFEEFSETWAERANAGAVRMPHQNITHPDGRHVPEKSLMGLPWRYALRCIDDLGLILRAEVIWSKPNGLPESVTDRVRRSHEQWFHFVQVPRYFSAVDEIREQYTAPPFRGQKVHKATTNGQTGNPAIGTWDASDYEHNPLGKLPGSVWTVPTEPLRVPDHLGVDHFAAFPTEWPKRIIQGWSPAGVCVECGEGRRPVVDKRLVNVWHDKPPVDTKFAGQSGAHMNNRKSDGDQMMQTFGSTEATITGYACACLAPTSETTPAVVLDPFGGTGTTALVAKALGRHGISVDMSADYCRLAEWRTNDRDQLAKVLGVAKAESEPTGTPSLLDLLDGGAA